MKRYKTYTLVLLIITVTALVVTAAMLSLKRSVSKRLEAGGVPVVRQVHSPMGVSSGPDTAYYTPNPAPSQENSATSGDTGSGPYLITIYKGRIGVFEDGRSTPVLTGDAQVYLLPDEDVRLLKKGIRASSLSEAKQILEDYD